MQTVEIIEKIKAEIRYTAKETRQLINELQESECFDKLVFLKKCVDLMDSGISFPKAWEKAIKSNPENFDSNDLEQIIYLSEVLGATDIQGQISALDMVKCNIENNLYQAEQNCQTKGKMYKSLGMLSGLAVAILTI